MSMDERLLERLIKINDHIEELKQAEKLYLALSAHEKVLYSKLFLNTRGEGNNEERKAMALVSEDWTNFVMGFVEAEANYLEAKRKYELKIKSFDAQYLTIKNELPALKRQ